MPAPRRECPAKPHPAMPGAGEVHLWFARGAAPMVMSVLSGYLGLPPERLSFQRGPHGKPELDPALGDVPDHHGKPELDLPSSSTATPRPNNTPSPMPNNTSPRPSGTPSPRSSASKLQFNLSHSGPWQVLAVSGGAAVGVDIEHCDSARDILRIARRFFTPAEVATLDSLQGDAARAYCFDCWVLKEATAKAAGDAMATTLAAVGFKPVFATVHHRDDKSSAAAAAHHQSAPAVDAHHHSDKLPESVTAHHHNNKSPAVAAVLHQDGEAPADGRARSYLLYDAAPGWPLALCVESAALPSIRIFEWRGEGHFTPTSLPLRAASPI